MNLPVIETTDLSKFYGKIRGIEHINLKVNEGEIFGFIGPNGAGKSTTIRILLNLIFPTSGSARIIGMDVVEQTKEIKRHIGYVPSDASPYTSMDVHRFLRYCLRFYRIKDGERRIDELSALFELDLKRKISGLSTGNRRKLSIIQSILHRPALLILDEPTTGLDPLMQARFFELLRKENHLGMTVFYSSHVLSEVQMLCKRVAIIKEGNIIQIEDIENLRRKQLKKVCIEFGGKGNRENFRIRGIESVIVDLESVFSFMFSGDMDELVRLLAERNILNLTIEEPSLEEIFMHYYR